ncbi:MAG: type II secretion system F family protein, partial [Massilia sp.]
MQFEVRALGADAAVAQLNIDALDEADARRQVESRGLFVAAVKQRGRAARASGLSLVLFSQELLALLSAGLGVVEALEALLEKEANPALANVLGRLLAGLREGKRFSSVLAEQGGRFPPLYIGIVKAAEGTSDLPRSLARYIDYQQRIDAVRAKIASAAIYPTILLAVGGGVSMFLITYVVPR